MSILQPMLASLADAPLDDPDLVYEPKYDGIRAIAEVAPRGAVRLWSRLGNEKTHQFPEIAAALQKWGKRLTAPVILDGEIVALDANGRPTGFQHLQGRIHLAERGRESFRGPKRPSRSNLQTAANRPGNDSRPLFSRVAFIAFDVLRESSTDFRDRPFVERRRELERIFGKTGSPILRLSESVRGDGRPLYKQALQSGWEGLIAKDAHSVYKSGKRTPDWRKLKILHEQEFVIGGWTEPRHTRSYFGALLLGVYEGDAASPKANLKSDISNRNCLVYVGHTGTGFNEKELARVMKLLEQLETGASPFCERVKTNQRPHWVKPQLVAQIKFTEWTADAKLRHPVYLGLRDDKKPEEVRRETKTRFHAGTEVRLQANRSLDATPEITPMTGKRRGKPNVREKPASNVRLKGGATRERTRSRADVPSPLSRTAIEQLVGELRSIEKSRKDAVLVLPDGKRLNISNLHKVFWPKQKLTKGDLFRYYAQVAPYILPAIADRPLVMKRYPNGITGKPFYQHRIESVPDGVRIEVVKVAESRPQIIGGRLITLMYTTQLAAISQDPWFSRVGSPQFADYVALDLDPMPDVPFARVLDVARWVHDELESLGAVGVAKTSGSDGLHIYIPLPPETSYDAGLLFCQIIATVIATKHPKAATVERSVRARGRTVYVDYLQNIPGKTLATAYSARASAYAGVSTPVTWREIEEGFEREAFTLQAIPARVEEVGDLWAALRESKGIDLTRVTQYAERRAKATRA